MTTVKIAVHQLTSGINLQENLHKMSSAISESASAGAKFYFAPEMSLLLDSDKSRAASQIGGADSHPIVDSLCAVAAEHKIWIHLGSLPIRIAGNSGKLVNRSIVIDDFGAVRAVYDKIHLFDVDLSTGESWRESSTYEAGQRAVLVETPLGPMGLAVCYDMRFPDLFSRYVQAGAHVLAIPAAFTVPTGKAHWHILLRARAIESAAFVIAAAQFGRHEDGRQTFGHSLVVSPWGEVLLDMRDGEGLGFADLDLARVAEVRAQIPVHLNRQNIPPL